MSFQQPSTPLVATPGLPYTSPGHAHSGGFSAGEGASAGGHDAPSAQAAAPGGPVSGNDSSLDRTIRANIQTIRSNLLAIEENLGNLNRRFVSRRIVESLHDRLRETYDIVLSTERLFKAWQAEQQGQSLDALERQRRRFLYEKLSAHFQEEIRKVQAISERVREAAERVADGSSFPAENGRSAEASSGEGLPSPTAPMSPLVPSGRGWRNGSEDRAALRPTAAAAQSGHAGSSTELSRKSGRAGTGSGVVLDLENVTMLDDDERDQFFIGDDEQEMCNEMADVAEHESLLQRVVAEERYRGLQRIHGQVKQANQIFKDLAQLVLQQDAGVESIESQMHSAHSHIKGAASELRIAHQMHRRSRQRRCLLLFLIFAVLSFLLYFYSSLSAVQRSPPSIASDTSLSLSAPVALSERSSGAFESVISPVVGQNGKNEGTSVPPHAIVGSRQLPGTISATQLTGRGTRFSIGNAMERLLESAPMGAGGPGLFLPSPLGGAPLDRGLRPQSAN
ncbi:putative SNARE domain-containing protein [Neospora caninum Liverpool]|uniref:Putative SNARE domain-containing protein n=1 Tax=Neospora caninum (strain Liverpool) TaxID=572307 RepID=F0VF23_NEOCL|nr:putative SNARE domain-containing protein [Neospora caninum Liverpool]CBZ52317.1 putative SNARE domain-containing protein [Neospora caninum Liverpool]CEL66285.1 TPA: SNARE domain-containing protein, putative [Neospora caninum Liverpool]|eukprot:XP_003882349.1 putative SNARE domain-containing protein [Neospora caninum Liverpool]